MSILDLGKIINPAEFQSYMDEADKMEVVGHKYGAVQVVPDYPCWMEYSNEDNVIGSISFSRHTAKHPILREMTQKVFHILENIFPSGIPVLIERIHLIRTKYNLPPHKDEAGRNACINIGVRNSSGAHTKMSNDGILENFKVNHSITAVAEGHAYLMNTNQFHSVECLNDNFRYLITYGFSEKYENLEKAFKNKLRLT